MTFDSARPLSVRSHLNFCVLRRRLRPGLGAPLRLQPEGDRTVVHQANLHVRPEHAALYPWVLGTRRRDEPLEQAPP
jgi:hypothetical protein